MPLVCLGAQSIDHSLSRNKIMHSELKLVRASEQSSGVEVRDLQGHEIIRNGGSGIRRVLRGLCLFSVV